MASCSGVSPLSSLETIASSSCSASSKLKSSIGRSAVMDRAMRQPGEKGQGYARTHAALSERRIEEKLPMLTSINPATGDTIATHAALTDAEIAEHLARAQPTFTQWRVTDRKSDVSGKSVSGRG